MKALRRFAQAALAATLLAFGPAALALEMPWNWHDEHVVQESRLMQWRQLNTSRAVLATAPVPSGWLAGAYVSGNLIDQVMHQQVGTVLEVKGVEKIDDLKIDIKALDVNFRVESPEVVLDLVASSKKRDVSVSIKGRGLLGYVGTTVSKGANPRPMAVFQVVMSHARPAVNWSNFSLSMPSFMKEFVAAGVMKFVGDEFRFEFPLTESPVLSLGDPPAEDRPEVKVRKVTVPIKETGGSIELETGHRNVDLTMPLNFATPLFTPQGVWLLASDKSFVPPADPEPSKLTDATVNALRRQVETMLQKTPAPEGDAAVFINQRALVAMVNKVRLLPEADRSAYAKSLNTSGNLFQDKWRDDTFGKGGVFVRGAKKDFLEVAVTLVDLSAQWAPKEGLHLTAAVQAKVTAALHWHFDPIVSGGFGDDVGIGGKGKVMANGTLAMRLVDLGDGQPAALMVPSLSCTVAPIEMSADADIKLGVKTGVTVFEERMTPISLLSTQPMRVAFPVPKPNPKLKVQITPRWAQPALDVVTQPSAANTTDDGFYIWTKLTSLAPAAPDADEKAAKEREKNLRAAMNKKLADYAKTLPAPTCPDKPDLRINIGGIEIGPNNELVKYSAAALEVINRTLQEGKKIIKTPGKAVKDAPDNFVREVKKVVKRICKWC